MRLKPVMGHDVNDVGGPETHGLLASKNRAAIEIGYDPNIPRIGQATLDPILKDSGLKKVLIQSSPQHNLSAGPNANENQNYIQSILASLAESSFIFGADSSSNGKGKKLKRVAQVAPKYSFDALCQESAVQIGRKEGLLGFVLWKLMNQVRQNDLVIMVKRMLNMFVLRGCVGLRGGRRWHSP
ncbi:ATP binding protein [Corchorus olitorius]|uniref:ATP binding protein n=1 Tax=Corchorus olitorius TaxID=93759 RepID=A0A1R3GU32_9ROSI|nr:ATP binding protein [Corchorus olitorius]